MRSILWIALAFAAAVVAWFVPCATLFLELVRPDGGDPLPR